MSPKSGGNEFHGGAFEFDRNNTLDADNYFTNAGRGTNFIRLDHNFNDKDRLSAHYILYRGRVLTGGTLPDTGGESNVSLQENAEVSESPTFSPTFLTQLRLANSRNKSQFDTQDSTLNGASFLAGVPGVVNALQNRWPSDHLHQRRLRHLCLADNIPQGRRSNTYELPSDSRRIITAGGLTHTITLWLRRPSRRNLALSLRHFRWFHLLRQIRPVRRYLPGLRERLANHHFVHPHRQHFRPLVVITGAGPGKNLDRWRL